MNRISLSPLAGGARVFGLELCVLALAYYCAARLGLQFAFQNTNISPLWPPSGLAMAAMIWRGSRVWPAIACGAFIANLSNFLASHSPLHIALIVSAIITVGNTGESLVGVFLLSRFGAGRRSPSRTTTGIEADELARPQGVVRFAALAGALSCVIPATIGALGVHFAGLSAETNTAYLWWTWWAGDVAGVVMLAPAILAWKYPDGNDSKTLFGQRRLEACLLFASATAVSVWVFGMVPLGGFHLYPLAYLVMPFLIWAAFRFGRIGASSAVLWVGVIAAWGTSHGGGPFVVENMNESLLLLQTFMGVVAMTALLLSGALSEQRAARNVLEVRIIERTAQLTQSHAELATSYARLQESETLRENLMHMIVHDLRMPLNALHYALRALTTAGELPPRQQSALDISQQSVQTLSDIISNLLDIHQLEAGALALRLKTVSPTVLAQNATAQVAFLAHYKGLSLVSNVAPDLPALNADEEKLGRVLTNLLDNAIRFTPTGGTLTLSVGHAALSAGKPAAVQFSVADTGPGIAREAFARIFEKFGRATMATGDEKSSSGLGLAFCKMIVEAHGGKIWVESEPQKGSTFYFVLPSHPSPDRGLDINGSDI